MHIEIKRGLDLRIRGESEQHIESAPTVPRVALVGADYPDLRPSLLVEPGQRVQLGEPLWRHRAFPELCFVAPGTGRVSEVNRGAKRSLQSVVIELDGESAADFPEAATAGSEPEIRALLMATGLWTAFRTRPFERVPLPQAHAQALLITAIDTEPLAPDPRVVIADAADEFAEGLARLAPLAPRRYLCAAPGITVPVVAGMEYATFSGPHPAGLVGTHVQHLPGVAALAPGEVWHIGYQDVITIGRLFLHGRLNPERVVAVGGPGARAPRLLRTRAGADLTALLAGECEGECRVISGSPLTGRAVNPATAFLGRYHRQVSLMPEAGARRPRWTQWLHPGGRPAVADTTARGGRGGGMLAVESFDAVWPFTVPPAPLLRALLIRDTEAAAALGCMSFAGEDLALCAYVCPGKLDYAAALAATQQDIERGR